MNLCAGYLVAQLLFFKFLSTLEQLPEPLSTDRKTKNFDGGVFFSMFSVYEGIVAGYVGMSVFAG